MTNIETFTTPNQAYVYSEDDFDGYSAAPLLIVGRGANRKLIRKQDALARNVGRLIMSELSDYVKPSVINFVGRSVVSRMQQREALNGNSYIHRSRRFPEPMNIAKSAEACKKAKYGNGSPIENELARHALGMKTVEYANLTIIGNARKQLEPQMWDDVSKLVDDDTAPRADQMYGLQLLGFDRDIRASAHIGAMRIGMKRRLGETEYGATVKARTTAIVNLSPSGGFDPNLVDYFRETAINGGRITDLPEFKKAVGWLVETQLPSGLVLARNETVYGIVQPDKDEAA